MKHTFYPPDTTDCSCIYKPLKPCPKVHLSHAFTMKHTPQPSYCDKFEDIFSVVIVTGRVNVFGFNLTERETDRQTETEKTMHPQVHLNRGSKPGPLNHDRIFYATETPKTTHPSVTLIRLIVINILWLFCHQDPLLKFLSPKGSAVLCIHNESRLLFPLPIIPGNEVLALITGWRCRMTEYVVPKAGWKCLLIMELW